MRGARSRTSSTSPPRRRRGETLPGKPAYGRSLIRGVSSSRRRRTRDREISPPSSIARTCRTSAPSCRAREPATEHVPVADASLTHGVWLERVPELVAERVRGVGARARRAVRAGSSGLRRSRGDGDGTPVVLKLVHPHRESEHEGDALERVGRRRRDPVARSRRSGTGCCSSGANRGRLSLPARTGPRRAHRVAAAGGSRPPSPSTRSRTRRRGGSAAATNGSSGDAARDAIDALAHAGRAGAAAPGPPR